MIVALKLSCGSLQYSLAQPTKIEVVRGAKNLSAGTSSNRQGKIFGNRISGLKLKIRWIVLKKGIREVTSSIPKQMRSEMHKDRTNRGALLSVS